MKLMGHFLFGSLMLSLRVADQEIECLLDTGFNGQLLIPENIIAELKLQQVGTADYVTADGDTAKTKVHIGYVNWFGGQKEVFVVSTSADFSLVGMGLLNECRLVIERRKNILELDQ